MCVSDIAVCDLISDHHTISCNLSVQPPLKNARTVTFRKISDINLNDFKNGYYRDKYIQKPSNYGLKRFSLQLYRRFQ